MAIFVQEEGSLAKAINYHYEEAVKIEGCCTQTILSTGLR